MDGWGRPYDVVGECRALGADVMVMQESLGARRRRAQHGGPVADRLGMEVVAEVGLAHGRLFAPSATAPATVGPAGGPAPQGLPISTANGGPRRRWRDRPSVRGRWGLAVLSRLPIRDVAVHPLGQLRRDPARRVVVEGTVGLDAGDLTVCGTHMSHITHGSHAQYRRLAAELPTGTEAAVLAGDMNLWGPPVSSYLPGWRRAVTGRTWPAHRPHSQLDHVLTTPSVSVVDARVGAFAGSDHRPVVVTLTVGAPTAAHP